jgi:hypothetical protein
MAVIIGNVMLKTGAEVSAQGVATSCAGGMVTQQMKVRAAGLWLH